MMIPSHAAAMEIPTGLYPTGSDPVGAPIRRRRTPGPRLNGLGDYSEDPVVNKYISDNCGFFSFGVLKPECWCLQHPSVCSTDSYKAAYAMAHPEIYNTLKEPPVVGAPTGDALTKAPASGADAQATIDRLLAEQLAAWKAQNEESIQETQDNIDRVPVPSVTGDLGKYILIAGGAIALILIARK